MYFYYAETKSKKTKSGFLSQDGVLMSGISKETNIYVQEQQAILQNSNLGKLFLYLIKSCENHRGL